MNLSFAKLICKRCFWKALGLIAFGAAVVALTMLLGVGPVGKVFDLGIAPETNLLGVLKWAWTLYVGLMFSEMLIEIVGFKVKI